MSPRRIIPNTAYTLLELSLVLVILSLLAAGIIAIVTQHIRRSAMMEVTAKMDVIEAALLDFRQINARLPCPADGTLPQSSALFGKEGIPSGNCTNTSQFGGSLGGLSDLASDGGTDVPPSANFVDSGFTVAGDVPTKTLGLSDDYMFDPWGGRFFYAVDRRMTAPSAFITYPVINANTNVGIISVYDGNGNAKVTVPDAGCIYGGAIAILMSYGPDGHGAIQYGGGVRKAVGNTNANTQTNCHCDANGASIGGVTASSGGLCGSGPVGWSFIQAPSTSTSSSDPANFDDIVRYYTRQSFVTSTDLKLTPTDPTTTR